MITDFLNEKTIQLKVKAAVEYTRDMEWNI